MKGTTLEFLFWLILFCALLAAILGLIIGAIYCVGYVIWFVSMTFPWPVFIVVSLVLTRMDVAAVGALIEDVRKFKRSPRAYGHFSGSGDKPSKRIVDFLGTSLKPMDSVNFRMPITEYPYFGQIKENWIESQRFGPKNPPAPIDETISTLHMSEYGAKRYVTALDKADFDSDGEQVEVFEAEIALQEIVRDVLRTDLRYARAIVSARNVARKFELDTEFKKWILQTEYVFLQLHEWQERYCGSKYSSERHESHV